MKTREWVLVAVTVAAMIIVLFVPPIPQDADYHQFADTRDLFGIPHFWNVVSNAGYLVVGIYAIRRTHRLSSPMLASGLSHLLHRRAGRVGGLVLVSLRAIDGFAVAGIGCRCPLPSWHCCRC